MTSGNAYTNKDLAGMLVSADADGRLTSGLVTEWPASEDGFDIAIRLFEVFRAGACPPVRVSLVDLRACGLMRATAV